MNRKLIELNELAKADGKKYNKKRYLHEIILHKKGRPFCSIIGPRGAGKTILLRQLLNELPNAFYISADTIENEDLFELAKTLRENYKIDFLLIDEIHFQKDYTKQLKLIYDFLEINVIFTSSVALSLLDSAYDLSRRVELNYIYPFSFKEYISFKTDTELAPLSLENIVNKNWSPQHLQLGYKFKDYISGGLFPFALENPDILSACNNILQKIIEKDIPSISNLKTHEPELIRKVLTFIGKSSVDGINYSSISNNIGITKYKAQEYINLLEKAFILHVVFPEGANVLREPKILMCLPYRLLFKEYEDALGGLREDFFAEAMKIRGHRFNYLKSTRGVKTPDFIIKDNNDKIVFEIGGKGKGRSQFRDVSYEKKLILVHSDSELDLTMDNKRPLFLLGYI